MESTKPSMNSVHGGPPINVCPHMFSSCSPPAPSAPAPFPPAPLSCSLLPNSTSDQGALVPGPTGWTGLGLPQLFPAPRWFCLPHRGGGIRTQFLWTTCSQRWLSPPRSRKHCFHTRGKLVQAYKHKMPVAGRSVGRLPGEASLAVSMFPEQVTSYSSLC